MAQKVSSNKVQKSKNPITGIINLTGEPDSGKTWFAWSSGAAPERTAFIDDDVKGQAIVKQIRRQGREIGLYRNLLLETKGMRELQFHDHCMSILEEIAEREGEFDVLIWDTWTRFENSFHPVVASNPNKYRQFYSSMGQIKGAEQWNAAFELEAATMAALQETVPLVILTSHLKKDAMKKEIAESKKPLIQKSIMRVWLRHSPDTPVPTGLFLKRLSKAEFGAMGMEPINVTHRKMLNFTWQNLLYYWEHPVGNSAPSADETPNEFELSILDGTLTKDQKIALELALEEIKKESREEEKQRKLMRQLSHAPEPEIPDDAFGLMSKAFAQFEIETDELVEILGVSDQDELLEIENVAEAWEIVKTYAAGKTDTKKVKSSSKANGKRRK